MNKWIPLMAPKGAEFDFTAGQLLDLVGWGVGSLLMAALMITVATRITSTIRAAEAGTAWPAITHAVGVAAVLYLCGQIPVPGSWNLTITSTYALLCDTVTCLALLMRLVAVLLLVPLVGLAVYALVRASAAPEDPSRWGPLTRLQVLLLGVRRWRNERRLAEILRTHTTGTTVSWWGRHAVTPPATPEKLPTVATWYMTNGAVTDHAALHRDVLATPMVAVVDIMTEDDTTRLRVEWDVKALAEIGEPARDGYLPWLGGRRRGEPPAPVIPAVYAAELAAGTGDHPRPGRV